MNINSSLSPKKQIKKGRINLNRNSPFFGYLVQYLKPVETKKIPTAGITEDATLLYNPDFIDSMSEDEVEGILAHEVMHKAMDLFSRMGYRDHEMSNVAHDLVVNYILYHENGFELPNNAENFEHITENIPDKLSEMCDDLSSEERDYLLLPDENGTFEQETMTGKQVKIENIGDKSFERIYDELYEQTDGEGLKGGFDVVMTVDAEDGTATFSTGDEEVEVDLDELGIDVDGEDGLENQDVDWNEIVSRAAQSAEQQGKKPGGIDSMLEVNSEGDVNYKRYIRQRVSQVMPSNYSLTRNSNKGRSVGEHLPSVRKKSRLEVIVGLDTSGSVSDALLNKFFGEIQSLSDTFEQVDLTVIQHDAQVQAVNEYKNASSSDFDKVEIKGRGGTSHVPVFEEIEDNHLESKEIYTIMLTDGYTTVPESIPVQDDRLLWVLNNYNIGMDRLKHGTIVRTDDPHKND